MNIVPRQEIERVLENIRTMSLPEDEDLFALDVEGSGSSWHVTGVVGPIAHTISEGQPYPVMQLLPLSDIELSSREKALDFATEVHDVLIGRGKHPEGSTSHLLETHLN